MNPKLILQRKAPLNKVAWFYGVPGVAACIFVMCLLPAIRNPSYTERMIGRIIIDVCLFYCWLAPILVLLNIKNTESPARKSFATIVSIIWLVIITMFIYFMRFGGAYLPRE